MGDEYYLRHPSKQMFFKLLASTMGILCLNTQYWGWYKLPASKLFRLQRILVPIFVPIVCISQITYLALNYQLYDFAGLAVILSIIPIGVVVWSKVITAQTRSYKKVSTLFMNEIHLYNVYVKKHPDHKHNVVKMMLINAEKKTRYSFCMIIAAISICYFSWLAVPILHNIQNQESIHNITTRLQFTAYFWTPYLNCEYNFYAYIFIQVVTIYCGSIAITILITFDTINLAIVYHLTGHIKILKDNLETEKNAKLSDKEWTQKLKEYSSTYSFLTRTFKDVQAAFGLNVATIYGQNLIQGGLLLFQIMTSGKDTEVIMTYGLMIPIFMGMLMLISIVLENLRVQTDDIPRLVYDLPWESMSILNQNMLKSLLFQVQPKLEFVAAFNIQTGVQPAMNIIKTTFSCYVMIKSSKEE